MAPKCRKFGERSQGCKLRKPHPGPGADPATPRWYRTFQYQAASWDRPRRMIAKVEYHLGELFPRVGFIVTILAGTNRAVSGSIISAGWPSSGSRKARGYPLKPALLPPLPSQRGAPELLGVTAYNLGNLRPRLLWMATGGTRSLRSLQQRLFKTGARLIRHARYFTLRLAESYLTGSLFRQILQRIKRLAWHPM